jgi:hypothetical protein
VAEFKKATNKLQSFDLPFPITKQNIQDKAQIALKKSHQNANFNPENHDLTQAIPSLQHRLKATKAGAHAPTGAECQVLSPDFALDSADQIAFTELDCVIMQKDMTARNSSHVGGSQHDDAAVKSRGVMYWVKQQMKKENPLPGIVCRHEESVEHCATELGKFAVGLAKECFVTAVKVGHYLDAFLENFPQQHYDDLPDCIAPEHASKSVETGSVSAGASTSALLDRFLLPHSSSSSDKSVHTRLQTHPSETVLKTVKYLEDHHLEMKMDIQLSADAGKNKKWKKDTWCRLLRVDAEPTNKPANNETFVVVPLLTDMEEGGEEPPQVRLHWYKFYSEQTKNYDDLDVESDSDNE